MRNFWIVMKINHKQMLTKQVEEVRISRGYRTYEQCCLAFNKFYEADIEKGSVKSLNKDFLYRVFNKQNFSISNPRFLKLCEFLKFKIDVVEVPIKISNAALMIDELLKQRPELEEQVNTVIKSIVMISKRV